MVLLIQICEDVKLNDDCHEYKEQVTLKDEEVKKLIKNMQT